MVKQHLEILLYGTFSDFCLLLPLFILNMSVYFKANALPFNAALELLHIYSKALTVKKDWFSTIFYW